MTRPVRSRVCCRARTNVPTTTSERPNVRHSANGCGRSYGSSTDLARLVVDGDLERGDIGEIWSDLAGLGRHIRVHARGVRLATHARGSAAATVRMRLGPREVEHAKYCQRGEEVPLHGVEEVRAATQVRGGLRLELGAGRLLLQQIHVPRVELVVH